MYELIEAKYGRFLINPNDVYVAHAMALYGEWSEAEVFLFQQIIRQGDVVLEVGANIGTHSVALSQACGETGKLYAIEANRHNHMLLCANLALNACFNAHPLHAAIGQSLGRMDFPTPSPMSRQNFGGLGRHVINSNVPYPMESIELITVDSLCKDFSRLDLIKSDLEGMDYEMLLGAEETIKRLQPIIYAELSPVTGLAAGNRDQLLDLLIPLGYTCYYYFAPAFNEANYKGCNENIMPFVSADLLCVPQGRAQVYGMLQAEYNDVYRVEGEFVTPPEIPDWRMASIT